MRDSTYTLAMAAVAVVSVGAIFLFKTQVQSGNVPRLEFSSAGGVMARQGVQPAASERGTGELKNKPLAPTAPFGRQAPLEAQQVSFDK